MGRIVVDSSQYEPKPIVGYCSEISVAPGQSVTFHVSCDGAPEFRADMMRLIHGDLHDAGPGLKEELVESPFSGTYDGVRQETYPGSYMILDDGAGPLGDLRGLTVQAMILPTSPAAGHPQAIVAQWSEDDAAGWALYVDESGRLSFRVGAGDPAIVALTKPLLTRVWYLASVSFEASTGRVALRQEPVLGAYNSRIALRHPTDDLADAVDDTLAARLPDTNPAPLTIAAWQQLRLDSGQVVVNGLFNGKIDRPRLASRSLAVEEIRKAIDEPLGVDGLLAAWDFAANITSAGIHDFTLATDLGPHALHGRLVNTPARGMTGHNWDGTEHSYRHAPDQYGAIHFHDDDLTDCGWEPTCEFQVPDDLPSGIYAAKLGAHIDGVDEEDYIPFFVRPPRGRRTSAIVYIAPTASYLAYGNDSMAPDAPIVELLSGSVPHFGENDLSRHQHREYGTSLYDVHGDGAGVCYSSWLRPLLTVRPKYRHTVSRVWQFNADLHLIDWFHRMGYPVDVVTDHDLHAEGPDLLRGYKLAVTGTHPEYYSGRMLDSVHAFLEQDGGRVMYLGGNGFYWVTAFSPEDPRIVEVRRWGGTEAWSAEPGQYHMSFTGEMGGLWRNRGRPPQKLVGVGFIAQGLEQATYFVRKPDSEDPDAEWILAGVGPTERIGDFGLEQGGAAGVEIDWYDPTLGSPGWAKILASSEGHSRFMLEVRENVGMTFPYMGGDMDPKVRADMVYFKTANDGAVFSTGSISWCGSLSHNDYDNNVSRIMKNVVDRFASDEPLP